MSNEGPQKTKPENRDIEWYNRAYAENRNLFAGSPDRLVLRAAEHLPPGSLVIDIGAGQGRNAIPLAERGFVVVARDLSEAGIHTLNTTIKERGFSNLHAECRDANEPIEGIYDMAISSLMLHHLTPEDARMLIQRMKECTKEGGFNVLRMFTAEGYLAREAKADGEDRYYPSIEETRALYADWDVLVNAEQEDEDEKRGGVRITNVVVYILAKKPMATAV